MRYEDYIKELERLKNLYENSIIGVVPDVENAAYEALLEWMDNSLEYRKGSLIASDETIDILNSFDAGYLKVLNQIKAYKGAVSSFVKELPTLSNLIQDYQIKASGIVWEKAQIPITNKVVINEIIKAYTDNGLNAEFVQPLRDQLYQNIIAGTSVKEAKEGLKQFVKGKDGKPGKLKSYLVQTSQQAVDSYTGAINKKLMDTFDYPYLIMSGSLIATSAPQCRFGVTELKGFISKQDFENKVLPLAEKNGLIKGTTFKSVTFNKLHWGCRHEFTPAMLKVGDKIGENTVLTNNGAVNSKNEEQITLRKQIYNLPLKKQYQSEFSIEKGGEVNVHQLVNRKKEDYNEVFNVAKAYAKNKNKVYLLPEIGETEQEARLKILKGIIGKSNPDLLVGKNYIDVKTPLSKNKIVKRAIEANRQEAIAVISDTNIKFEERDINYFSNKIFGDKNYTKDEIHWFTNNKIIIIKRVKKQ